MRYLYVDERRGEGRAAGYKLTNVDGLYLSVASTGLRSWRWLFRIKGCE
ncbi:DUF4102 domain-containing protein [Sphingomonas sp. MA1305]|nr:DUF4102 domain-containing protein [Sphingomonas sp. MA1305]MBI0475883.1 DUF4102 domain-containing protein [Sphingomonas sp. MA1305]